MKKKFLALTISVAASVGTVGLVATPAFAGGNGCVTTGHGQVCAGGSGSSGGGGGHSTGTNVNGAFGQGGCGVGGSGGNGGHVDSHRSVGGGSGSVACLI